MLWFVFALITAFSEATKDMFSKKVMKEVDVYVTAWSLAAFSFLFLLPLLFIIDVPVLGDFFWHAIFLQTILLTISLILYMKAIKTSPLSVTLPMLAFTPAFMLITSPLMLGESPGFFGIVGILLIVLGAYALNVQRVGDGFLTPFKALLEEEGPILMMIVAFIWSIAANVDKIGVLNSSPLFYVVIVEGAVSAGLFIAMHVKSENYQKQIKNNLKGLLPLGFFFAIGLSSQMIALKLTYATFVISVKRTSILVGSIYGFIFFKETQIKQRVLGGLIMIFGILLITLF